MLTKRPGSSEVRRTRRSSVALASPHATLGPLPRAIRRRRASSRERRTAAERGDRARRRGRRIRGSRSTPAASRSPRRPKSRRASASAMCATLSGCWSSSPRRCRQARASGDRAPAIALEQRSAAGQVAIAEDEVRESFLGPASLSHSTLEQEQRSDRQAREWCGSSRDRHARLFGTSYEGLRPKRPAAWSDRAERCVRVGPHAGDCRSRGRGRSPPALPLRPFRSSDAGPARRSQPRQGGSHTHGAGGGAKLRPSRAARRLGRTRRAALIQRGPEGGVWDSPRGDWSYNAPAPFGSGSRRRRWTAAAARGVAATASRAG